MTNKEKAERYRAKKTKAFPKHTLFGTALEQHDREDWEKIEKIDDATTAEVNKAFKRTYSYNTLPKDVKSELPGNEILEHSKEEADKQREQTSRARELLKSLEERSLFFCSPIQVQNTKVRASNSAVTSRPPQWITRKDIQNAEEINAVGLNDKTFNYDHQRYRQKPPVHQYSLIGDLLRGGEMEFPHINKNQPHQSQSASPTRKQPSPNLYYSRVKAGQTQHIKPQKSAIQLPPNIRHTFGSRICDNLLHDPETVHNTMNHQEKLMNVNKRKTSSGSGKEKNRVESPKSPVDPAYHALGCALRQDIFPGYTYGHKISTVNDVYRPEVFERRYRDPEQYRYQRDAVSTWAEQNVLRERMKRAWAEYSLQPKVE